MVATRPATWGGAPVVVRGGFPLDAEMLGELSDLMGAEVALRDAARERWVARPDSPLARAPGVRSLQGRRDRGRRRHRVSVGGGATRRVAVGSGRRAAHAAGRRDGRRPPADPGRRRARPAGRARHRARPLRTHRPARARPRRPRARGGRGRPRPHGRGGLRRGGRARARVRVHDRRAARPRASGSCRPSAWPPGARWRGAWPTSSRTRSSPSSSRSRPCGAPWTRTAPRTAGAVPGPVPRVERHHPRRAALAARHRRGVQPVRAHAAAAPGPDRPGRARGAASSRSTARGRRRCAIETAARRGPAARARATATCSRARSGTWSRNALEAMPDGGTLRGADARGRRGRGPRGRPTPGPASREEQRTRLFTPYYTTKKGGTGLGLAIVQGIVSDHGGRIQVESAPGAGTTFTLVLPSAPIMAVVASDT